MILFDTEERVAVYIEGQNKIKVETNSTYLRAIIHNNFCPFVSEPK